MENGTSHRQRMLQGVLHLLATLALPANSPSVIIVASLVSLRRRLNQFFSEETLVELKLQA